MKYVQIVNMHENELLSEYSDKYRSLPEKASA